MLHADGHLVHDGGPGHRPLDEPSVGGIVVNLRDMTERRAVEAELAEVQARFQVAFEHTPIGMAMFAADGIIIRVNSAFAEMLGRTPDQLAGRRSRRSPHPDDVYVSVDQLRELTAGEITRLPAREALLPRRRAHRVGVVDRGCRARCRRWRPLRHRADRRHHRAQGDRAAIAHQAIHDPMTGSPQPHGSSSTGSGSRSSSRRSAGHASV